MKKTPIPIWPIVVFLVVFPWFLRRRPRVVRMMTVRARPADVFPLLNDLRKWRLWTVWGREQEMQATYLGPEAGVGATQRWEMKKMDGVMSITRSTPDALVQYDLRMARGKHQIVGRISVEPIGEKFSRITWKCTWDASPNPYKRYLDLLFQWWIGRDFGASLANLKELVESPTRQALANALV